MLRMQKSQNSNEVKNGCTNSRVRIAISPVHVKTWHLEKSWDLVIYALIFSEFGYVPDFFYVPNFFLEHSQIQKKSRQKWLSPNFFLSVRFLHGQGYNVYYKLIGTKKGPRKTWMDNEKAVWLYCSVEKNPEQGKWKFLQKTCFHQMVIIVVRY